MASFVGGVLAVAAYYVAPNVIKPYVNTYLHQEYPAVEAIEQEKQVFPQALKQLLNQANDQEAAIATLYKVWGYRASVLDQLCLDSGDGLFRCTLASGSLLQIIDNNLPVVLTLTIDGQSRYAVLRQVTDTQVQLLLNDQLVEFDRQWLSSIWQGEYREIWQSYWKETLKPGMSGQAIVELDTHLSQVLGEKPSGNTLYDNHLKRKVELFQRWQGLTVDGIAGQRTLNLLEKLSQPQAPALMLQEVSENV
jgi:general secretion pathway protein A